MKIPGFSRYDYIDGEFYDGSKIKNLVNKPKGSPAYKVKNDKGRWTYLSISKIKSIAGETISMPSTAKQLPFDDDYFVDINGDIYTFSISYPAGKKLSHQVNKEGYLCVNIKGKTYDVHRLVAETFIIKGYTELKLCCRHRDNNKQNPMLDNLCVGSYSQNNKDAYRDGLNNGNAKGINKKNGG